MDFSQFAARVARLVAVVCALTAQTALATDIPVPVQRPDPGIAAPAQPQAPSQSVSEPTAPKAPDAKPVDSKSAAPQPPAVPFVHRSACPALLSGRIEAEPAPPLRDGDCGEDSPLELRGAAGVEFSGRPLVTCSMAGELAGFAEFAVTSARSILETDLKAILTGPGYECRRRNRATTGKLSEHAFANALDIAGFRLGDGTEILIGEQWPRAAKPEAAPAADDDGESREAAPSLAERAMTPAQKFLAEVHEAACRRFTTVLSPDSNAAHESHLHFDLGCHGRDCRYLICE